MKRSFIIISLLVLCTLCGRAQSLGVFINDTQGPYTNVRNSPKGQIVDKIPVNSSAMFVVEKPVNGWWSIAGGDYDAILTGDFDNYHLKGSSTGYWVHYSTIAVATRNYGGQALPLRSRPSAKATVTFTIKTEQQLRPIDISGDWVKVKTLDGRHSGWIEAEWLCGNSVTTCC